MIMDKITYTISVSNKNFFHRFNNNNNNNNNNNKLSIKFESAKIRADERGEHINPQAKSHIMLGYRVTRFVNQEVFKI